MSIKHADGNIQYANYQSESQLTEYLTANGFSSTVSEIISLLKLNIELVIEIGVELKTN
tara:strand:+ start:286 stop:462 length:177 start_codon:yes stop_codon:yes gene_type:complete